MIGCFLFHGLLNLTGKLIQFLHILLIRAAAGKLVHDRVLRHSRNSSNAVKPCADQGVLQLQQRVLVGPVAVDYCQDYSRPISRHTSQPGYCRARDPPAKGRNSHNTYIITAE